MFNDLIFKFYLSIYIECDNGKGLWVRLNKSKK